MSACARYEADISALLDGELDAAAEAELREHLTACPDCRALYDMFSLLHADAQDPPADLTARIMDAVRAEEADNITPMPKRKKSRWAPWLAAAACFVVILGAVTLPRLTAHRSETVPMTASVSSTHPGDAVPDRSLDTSGEADAEAADSAAPEESPAEGLAAGSEALALSEPEQIAAVRALLTDPAPVDAPDGAAEPLLLLREGEETTEICLDRDDVYYTADGEHYFRCTGAADALIEYLAQLY